MYHRVGVASRVRGRAFGFLAEVDQICPGSGEVPRVEGVDGQVPAEGDGGDHGIEGAGSGLLTRGAEGCGDRAELAGGLGVRP